MSGQGRARSPRADGTSRRNDDGHAGHAGANSCYARHVSTHRASPHPPGCRVSARAGRQTPWKPHRGNARRDTSLNSRGEVRRFGERRKKKGRGRAGLCVISGDARVAEDAGVAKILNERALFRQS